MTELASSLRKMAVKSRCGVRRALLRLINEVIFLIQIKINTFRPFLGISSLEQ
jgi:hypothetical protein